jgi:alpha-beta hydrolase superfamily lysophospholipase
MEPVSDAPILVLGHGASGSAASMAPHVAGLRARGIDARAINLPKGRAERAVPRFAALLAGGLAADALGLAADGPDVTAGLRLAVGGHSFGGRVASLAAADACEAGRPPLALVLLSYPLHPPGRPDEWDARTAALAAAHLPGDPAVRDLGPVRSAHPAPTGRRGTAPGRGARRVSAPGSWAGRRTQRRPGPCRGIRARRGGVNSRSTSVSASGRPGGAS